jgi:hypothetical protein
MSDIDPREFGMLTQQVTTLEKQVTDLQIDVKKLLAMANQSKGGLWAGMAISSALGAFASWFVGHWWIK